MKFQQLEQITEELLDNQLDKVIKTLNKDEKDTSKENRYDKLNIIYLYTEKDINEAIEKIKSDIWNKLNNLSLNQLYKLSNLLGVGFLNEPEDKDELVLILSTESAAKLEEAISKIGK